MLEEDTKKYFETILEENCNLKKDCESLKSIGRNLKEEMKEMKMKLETYEFEKFKRKFCIHCKNEYNPWKNENVS